MRRRKAFYAVALLLAGTALAPAFDRAAEPQAKPAPQAQPDIAADTRRAVGAYRSGDKIQAAHIFAAAAERGHLPAQWKLARMLAAGDGIDADVARAVDLYATISNRYADRDPALRDVPFVADATREAGRMMLAGAPDLDTVRTARRHLYRAATTYRDGEARYLLGVSMLNEAHGAVLQRTAYRWLRSAAARGHAVAAVRMGEMQVAGIGTEANAAAGLVVMARGVERAAESDRPSLTLRFQAALASVDDSVRLGITAEMARLGLEAAARPIMQAVAE